MLDRRDGAPHCGIDGDAKQLALEHHRVAAIHVCHEDRNGPAPLLT
jgi:hypothetical protein